MYNGNIRVLYGENQFFFLDLIRTEESQLMTNLRWN